MARHYVNISWKGQTKTIAQWTRKLRLTTNILYSRFCRQKWGAERAFTTSFGKAQVIENITN